MNLRAPAQHLYRRFRPVNPVEQGTLQGVLYDCDAGTVSLYQVFETRSVADVDYAEVGFPAVGSQAQFAIGPVQVAQLQAAAGSVHHPGQHVPVHGFRASRALLQIVKLVGNNVPAGLLPDESGFSLQQPADGADGPLPIAQHAMEEADNRQDVAAQSVAVLPWEC